MPPQGTTVLDDFTRGAGPPGSNYGPRPFGADIGSYLTISSTNDLEASIEAYCNLYWLTPFGPNCYAGFNLKALPTGTSASARAFLGAIGGIGTGSVDGYHLLVTASEVIIAIITNGNDTTIASVSHTPQAGDDYIMERIGANFEVWRRRGGTWTSLLTATNATHTGAGYIGLDMYDPGSVGRIDNFYGGTIADLGTTYDRAGLAIVGP